LPRLYFCHSFAIFKNRTGVIFKIELKCALGGTFDHFHDGHKALLDKAISQNRHLIIGLTTTDLLKNKKYPEFIQAYEERKQSIINYLTKERQFENFTV
jgi:cytidyltransferase-like protein